MAGAPFLACSSNWAFSSSTCTDHHSKHRITSYGAALKSCNSLPAQLQARDGKQQAASGDAFRLPPPPTCTLCSASSASCSRDLVWLATTMMLSRFFSSTPEICGQWRRQGGEGKVGKEGIRQSVTRLIAIDDVPDSGADTSKADAAAEGESMC